MAKKQSKQKIASKTSYIPGFGRIEVGGVVTSEAEAAIKMWKTICNPPKQNNDNPTKSSDK